MLAFLTPPDHSMAFALRGFSSPWGAHDEIYRARYTKLIARQADASRRRSG